MIQAIGCLLAFFLSSAVWAAPATELQLSYDAQAQILHIQANHPTDRMDRYYIRRVLVRNSAGVEQSFDFTRQSAPALFEANLNYPANPGERLDIELYSSEGGKAAASINIPNAAMKG